MSRLITIIIFIGIIFGIVHSTMKEDEDSYPKSNTEDIDFWEEDKKEEVEKVYTPEPAESTPESSSPPVYTPPAKKERRCSKCSGTGHCHVCGGRGTLLCSDHDSNRDGYCTQCDNLGYENCFQCNWGDGICRSCKGRGTY